MGRGEAFYTTGRAEKSGPVRTSSWNRMNANYELYECNQVISIEPLELRESEYS